MVVWEVAAVIVGTVYLGCVVRKEAEGIIGLRMGVIRTLMFEVNVFCHIAIFGLVTQLFEGLRGSKENARLEFRVGSWSLSWFCGREIVHPIYSFRYTNVMHIFIVLHAMS